MASQFQRWWFPLALGFCLAGSEARQYTAVFDYNGNKSLITIVVSIVVVIVGYLMLAALFRKGGKSRATVALYAFFSVIQTAALVVQISVAVGTEFSSAASVILTALGETYTVGFVMITIILAQNRGINSLMDFIAAFAIAGIIQFLVSLLKQDVAYICIGLIPALSFTFFLFAYRADISPVVGQFYPSHEKLSGDVTRPSIAWRSFRGEIPILLFDLFLMGALLVCTHGTRMGYQDGGFYSFTIQVLSGLFGLAAAIVLFYLHRKLHGILRITLPFLLVLTLLLGALYVTSLFRNVISLCILIFIHRFAYILIYYFLWVLCLNPFRNTHLYMRYLAAFFMLKLGWATGVLIFMTYPSVSGSDLWQIAPLVFLLAMCLVDVFLFIRMTNSSSGRRSVNLNEGDSGSFEGNKDEVNKAAEMIYKEKCSQIADRFGLTKRETEVFELLGKGRTSSYIQKAMVISEGTARTHIDHIYKKLGIHKQQELIDLIEAESEDEGLED